MVVVTVTSDIRLMGIGIARPVLKTENGTVEYFEILEGTESTSPVIFRDLENRNLMPRGAQSSDVMQSLYLRHAVPLRAM